MLKRDCHFLATFEMHLLLFVCTVSSDVSLCFIPVGGGLSTSGRRDGAEMLVDVCSQREGQVHLRHTAFAEQTAHCGHPIPEGRSGTPVLRLTN